MKYFIIDSIASEKKLVFAHGDGVSAMFRISSPTQSIAIAVDRSKLVEMLREALGLAAEEKETTNE